MHTVTPSPFVALFLLAVPVCSIGPVAAAGVSALTGTTWELVSIQSMDDAVGTATIADPSLYTVSFGEDGQVAFRFKCNWGHSSWEASTSARDSGQLGFGPIAVTHARGPPSSVDGRIARDIEYVRSYLIRDGRLHMSLMSDGGIYTWRPANSGTSGRLTG